MHANIRHKSTFGRERKNSNARRTRKQKALLVVNEKQQNMQNTQAKSTFGCKGKRQSAQNLQNSQNSQAKSTFKRKASRKKEAKVRRQ
jgi:hypothetical protein